MTGLELASSVMLVLDYALDRHEAKQLAANSLEAANVLTSLHLQDFPRATAPVAASAPRRLRRFGRVDQAEQSDLDTAHAEELNRWDLLSAHDVDEVIATVDDALADNASPSTCIDAGVAPRNYVTVVVRYPGPEIAEGVVRVGRNTRPRTEAEKITLYRNAVASTVIATAKEALASAPAASEARIAVLRYDLRGRFRKRELQLDAIYVGALDRNVLDMDWTTTEAVEVMVSARDVQINLDRKGRFKPLNVDADNDLRELVVAITAATGTAPQSPRRRRRFTRGESEQLITAQERENFVAICKCPGCGEVGTHALQQTRAGNPSWATVIRTCATCNRQWAQA